MMLEMDSRSLAVGITALALVLLFTFPSLTAIASHLRNTKPKSSTYEDKDGAATEKSVAEYTAKIPKIALAIFTISGLSLSIILAVLDIACEDDGMFIQNWLNVAQSVSLRDASLLDIY
jgi:hypothetical protein